MIKKAQASPDVDNYLCYLTITPIDGGRVGLQNTALLSARKAAVVLLKNDIKTGYKSLQTSTRSYIQANILQGISDEDSQMRNLTGTVISELLKQAGVMQWRGFLPDLLGLITSNQTSLRTQEGASNALSKVCEDNRKALSRSYQSQCPLDTLVPSLLRFTSHPSNTVKAHALASLDWFIPEKYEQIMQSLDALLERLFDLARDQNDELRKQICRSVLHVAEVSPGRIAQHMSGLVDYMITQQQSMDDSELSLAAADFFLYVSEDKLLRRALEPWLAKLIPVLLESMIYQEEDVLRLEDEAEEDAEQEDREQDIKPQFASAKAGRNAESTESNGVNGGAVKLEFAADDDLSEGELEEYADGDEDDPETQWNLRKCSAATLDVLASAFGKSVFDNTLPYLQKNLQHTDWPNREAAVLALGAIAEGCRDAIEPSLPRLIEFLLSLLQDAQPVVRQITCWSLGRYSAWASHLPESEKESYFLPMMSGILQCMLDKNKRVQEAAASAFANLEEKANKQLENPRYCKVIAKQFAQCFDKYKDRNMFILYDCVQTLAEHVGPSLRDPELVQTLIPPIMTRWHKVSNHSREMFPLLECLSYVATALGAAFAPYAIPIFDRCIKIVFSNLNDSLAAARNPSLDEPDPDFLVTSLDLLSAIIQALGPSNNSPEHSSVKLVQSTQPNMFEMMVFCLENPNPDVRQSAYALLGDCAIYIYPAISPWLEKIMPLLVAQLDLSHSAGGSDGAPFAVTNNACWSCGEISMRARTDMSPYIKDLLERMYTILVTEGVPTSLRENAAIAMGRLANSCADLLAPHVGDLVPHLLRSMKGISVTEEKVQAMQGVAEVARRNPRGLEHCFLELIGQIADITAAQYQMGKEEHDAFLKVSDESSHAILLTLLLTTTQVLVEYKQLLPDFDRVIQGLGSENAQILKLNYGL